MLWTGFSYNEAGLFCFSHQCFSKQHTNQTSSKSKFISIIKSLSFFQRLIASIAIRTRASRPSTSWKLKSRAVLMQEIPSLLDVPPELAFAAAKAIRDFLDASMAKFTSCACKLHCWNLKVNIWMHRISIFRQSRNELAIFCNGMELPKYLWPTT